MSLDVKRTRIADGIFFTSINSSKFKTNRVSVSLIAPLKVETASDYALLPLILKKGFRDCPNPAEFQKLLMGLYGASCDGDVRKLGDNQLISLSISAIDDKFTLNGEKTSLEISKILCSLLLDPVIENGGFKQEFFETEKKALIDQIKAELNNKRTLAATRCQQIVYDGENAAIGKLGLLSEAEKLSCREVFDSYNELLRKARIEIFFTGCGDSQGALEIFSSALLSSTEREKPYEILNSVTKHMGEIKFVTEEYNITQSKLSLGFTTETTILDSDEQAMNMMCLLFGGAPFSKLFLNVREKLSLCYYCSSAYDHAKGTIFVNSGIQADDREKTQAEILNQLENMQNGDISDEELMNARRLVSNSYTGIEDSISRLENFFLTRYLSDIDTTPEKELEARLNVTKEEIINASRKVKLNTVYFMKPKEEN